MTKEATRLKMLDVHSSAEEVLAALIDERLTKKNTRKYKNKWQTTGQSRDSLLEFMKGPVVAKQFARQWIFETKPEWKDRTFAVAMGNNWSHACGYFR